MEYVMVPVPEELRSEIMGVIGEIAFREALSNWDTDALTTFYREASESEKDLIDRLVDASRTSTRRSRRALAVDLGLTESELDVQATEVNQRAAAEGNPWLIMSSKSSDDASEPAASSLYLISNVADALAALD